MSRKLMLLILISSFIIVSSCIVIITSKFLADQHALETNTSFGFMRGNLMRLIKKDGIAKTVDKIDAARQANTIDINQCHDLLHLVGHAAYEQDAANWSIIISPKSDICFYGFEHGVEAQIVFANSTDSETLFTSLQIYCDKLKNKFTDIYCYHGVGHAFVQEGQPIESALKNCDKVVENTDVDPLDCYRGAFSEYVNRLAGIDGDTNAPIPGAVPTQIAKDKAYDICLKLNLKYQRACVAQFTAFIFNNDLDFSLLTCNNYKDWIANLCAFKVSEAYTSNNLERLRVINPPEFFANLPQNVRQGYIAGVKSGYIPFRGEEVFKNANSWCKSLPYQNDRDFCLKGL